MGKSSRKPGSKAAVAHSKQQKTVIQKIAVNNAVKHFKSNARALITMACGSGKTRVGFMTIERMKKTISIIAVPTLGLVKQMRDDAAAWPELSKHSQLLVCSSIRHGDVHERPEDYGLNVTTSPEVILDALRNASTRSKLLIVVTYQSFDKIAAAMQLAKKRKQNVELGMLVCDEAHNTAGDKTKKMSLCLSDKAAKISKRLFLTATPRVIGDRTKNPENHNCMDDGKVYGKNVYSLSFAEAIQKGITSDYEIRNMEVNWKGDAAKKLNSRSFQKSSSRVDELARYLAREMKKRPGMRVFSFHTDCASAEAFNAALVKCGVWSRCITGEMPVNEREQILGEFEANGKSRVICSVRVFGEGVDVPSVDTVVFTDPLTSEIQIAQMVGRGQRIEEGKSLLSVYLPIFHPIGATSEVAEKTAKCSYFKTAIKVLRTMSSFDDRVVGEIRSKAEGNDSDDKNMSLSIFKQDGMSAEFAKVVNAILISKVAPWEPRSLDEFVCLLKSAFSQRPVIKQSNMPVIQVGGKRLDSWGNWVQVEFGITLSDVLDMAFPESVFDPLNVSEFVSAVRERYDDRPVVEHNSTMLLGRTIGAWYGYFKRKQFSKSLAEALDEAFPETKDWSPISLEALIAAIRDALQCRPTSVYQCDVEIKGRPLRNCGSWTKKFKKTIVEVVSLAFPEKVFVPRSIEELVWEFRQECVSRPLTNVHRIVAGRSVRKWGEFVSTEYELTLSQFFDLCWPKSAIKNPVNVSEISDLIIESGLSRSEITKDSVIGGRKVKSWRQYVHRMKCGMSFYEIIDLALGDSVESGVLSIPQAVAMLRKDHKHRPSFGEAPCGLTADKWEEIAKRLNTTVAAIMDKAFKTKS